MVQTAQINTAFTLCVQGKLPASKHAEPPAALAPLPDVPRDSLILGRLPAPQRVPSSEEPQPEPRREDDEQAREPEERYGLCWDDALQQRLQRMAAKILPLAKRADLSYRFRLLDTPVPLAAAHPDGTIDFSRGFLQALPDDAELLFFGAHELTHTDERHYDRRRSRFQSLQRTAPVLAMVDGNELRCALEMALLTELRHQEEFEADRGGLRILEALGYSKRCAVRGLEQLKEATRNCTPPSGGLFDFSSHPPFEERIRRLDVTSVNSRTAILAGAVRRLRRVTAR